MINQLFIVEEKNFRGKWFISGMGVSRFCALFAAFQIAPEDKFKFLHKQGRARLLRMDIETATTSVLRPKK